MGYGPWGHKESDTTEATDHSTARFKKTKYCTTYSLTNVTHEESNISKLIS